MKPEVSWEPERVRELIDRAKDPPETAQQPGKLKILTVVLAALTILCGASGALGLGPRYTLPLAMLFGFFALYSLFEDLLLPSPRDRRTADAAAMCFGKALKKSRWKIAHACMHRDTSPDGVQVPDVPLLNAMPGVASFSTLSGFKRHWRSILRGNASTIRVCRKVDISDLKKDGDCMTGHMILTVERASTLTWLGLLLGLLPAVLIYKLTMKMITVRYRITLFPHRSQWWMLPPSYEEAYRE